MTGRRRDEEGRMRPEILRKEDMARQVARYGRDIILSHTDRQTEQPQL